MPASKSDIRGWLDAAQAEGGTHMIVFCDTYDYHGGGGDRCCYPVTVTADQDARDVIEKNNDRLMEVYSLTGAHTIDAQLSAARAFNYD